MSLPSRDDQAARWFPRIPPWLIRLTTRLQVWVYERSDGRLYSKSMGMHHLLMWTVGRKSGRTNTCCLPFWLDPNGQRIIVASLGGGPRNPAWVHNLADRSANPEVLVRDKRRRFHAEAEILEGGDREDIWKLLVLDRPFYLDYQARTEREIPLVRLIETRPFEG